MKVGEKYKLKDKQYSSTGLVPSGTIVKIDSIYKEDNPIRVKDHVGRIFWVQQSSLIPLDDIYTKRE